MEPWRRTRAIGLFGALVALLLAACSGSGTFGEAVEADQLLAMDQVAEVRERFNEDVGSPRLILLLSPT